MLCTEDCSQYYFAKMYECSICQQHARKSLSGILRHIREVHPHFNGKVTCGVNGCPSTPSTYEGLRQHIYRYHKELLCSASDHDTEEGIARDDSSTQLDDNLVNQEEDEENVLSPCFHSSEQLSATVIGAKFILKTRDGKKLTQVTTNGIMEDSKLLVQNTVQTIERRVMETLSFGGVADDIISKVQAVFCDKRLRNPFHGLKTQYLQEKFIQENFNYVVRCVVNYWLAK